MDPERRIPSIPGWKTSYYLYQLTATLIYIYIHIMLNVYNYLYLYVYVFIYDMQRDSFLTWHMGCLRRSPGVCCNFKEINI